MKILKKIVQIVSWFCYVIILAGILMIAPKVIGYNPVVVLSGSMEPTYPVGSLIYYKQANLEDIQEGDAITFKIGDDTLVTHRVIVKNGLSQTFETKGDANDTKDQNPVSYDNVVGKTSKFSLPYVGFIFNSPYKVLGIAVIGLILVINIVLGYVGQEEKVGKKHEK